MASPAATQLSSRQLRRSLPLVDRFLVREARLRNEQSGASTLAASEPYTSNGIERRQRRARQTAQRTNPSPFVPYKHPVSGRWLPPRLSLRRQAQLAKSAYREGRLDEVVQQASALQSRLGHTTKTVPSMPTGSAKIDKMAARIAELSMEQGSKASSSALSSSYSDLAKAKAPAATATADAAQEDPRDVYRLARSLAATSGPYSGRSMRAIFKGTRAEREAPARRRNIAERLEGMEESILEWRQSQKQTKLKAKPKLPF